MARVDDYRAELRALGDWEPYLNERSGLPGPRANLELLAAVVEEAPAAVAWRLARGGDGYPAMCGVAALGRLAAEGDADAVPELRRRASDPDWRMREAVAMGLQRLGDASTEALFDVLERWAGGTPLERRAAVAAACEPRLLRDPAVARRALALLDRITASLAAGPDRRRDEVRVVRQALGYGWSVAIAALPDEGRPAFERWLHTGDPDVRWVVRENLRKRRLHRIDPQWVATMRDRLEKEGAPTRRESG
ncbi:MAG: HEAT repeat domain-containing protein [Actinomycetota bacterium]